MRKKLFRPLLRIFRTIDLGGIERVRDDRLSQEIGCVEIDSERQSDVPVVSRE